MLLPDEHLCSYHAGMSDLLADFERDCSAANVAPSAALRAGGVHPSLWKKWKDGAVSPTLRNFEAARRGLGQLRKRDAA
jgi:hypothetical protein